MTHDPIKYVNYLIKLELTAEYDLDHKEILIKNAYKNRMVDIFPIFKAPELPNYEHQEEEDEE